MAFEQKKRRGAEAARATALEEKQRRDEEAFVAALEEQKRREAEAARVAALEEKKRRDLEERKRRDAKAKAKKERAAARRAAGSKTTKEREISVGTPPCYEESNLTSQLFLHLGWGLAARPQGVKKTPRFNSKFPLW